MARALAAVTAAALVAVLAAGCFDVQSADLFLLTRTGQGGKLTMLVNDGGTIRCNGGKAKPISNTLLITARDLADNLAKDAQKKLTIPACRARSTTTGSACSRGRSPFPTGRSDPQGPESGRAVCRPGGPERVRAQRLSRGLRGVGGR